VLSDDVAFIGAQFTAALIIAPFAVGRVIIAVMQRYKALSTIGWSQLKIQILIRAFIFYSLTAMLHSALMVAGPGFMYTIRAGQK